MKEEFDIIADDEQARKMNEEYEKLGIVMSGAGENTVKAENNAQAASENNRYEKAAEEDGQTERGRVNKEDGKTSTLSAMINTPLPVYMLSDCVRYLELAESAGAIINNLDKRFLNVYKNELEYIYVKEDKNSIYIRELADIRSDIRAQYSPMPLKAALSSLLKIVTTQSMLLDKILFYDRSGKSKEIRLNQLSLACALNSLVLIVFC